MTPALDQKLETLPTTPGVYLFKDKKGDILYVGKAKVLRSRVRSYFQPGAQLEPAKQQMVQKITDLETISTDTETESLILEANLIRAHQPPYNVVLRDDKYYLFIKITKEKLPRVFPVRRIQKDGARYFGPYSSARAVRHTLRLLRRIFPFRAEKESPRDQIFPHPLFKSDNSTSTYQENIQNIIRFLQGDRQHLIKTLRTGMKDSAKSRNFERAALFRDQLQAVERLEGHQKVYLPRPESFDIISLAQRGSQSAANLFQVRRGRLLGKQTFLLKHRGSTNPADILRQFLLQYYSVAQDIPATIFLPFELEDQSILTTWLAAKVKPTTREPVLAVPFRGPKKQLLAMGVTNADQLLDEQQAGFELEAKASAAHHALMDALGLNPEKTHRIETYDISNIQGQLATASMVVFVDGTPRKDQYRKFRMRVDGTPNDFAMIQEALSRRLKHLSTSAHTQWPRPDLLVIDGGKGQLSAARKILQQYQLNIPIISLAKREEEIFLPNQPEPLRLPYDSPALQLLQRMRDEAHRFTITYHRLLRSKQGKRSILDEIPGIGPKTKQQLLRHFGSLKGIRAAAKKDIATVIGSAKAKILRDYL